MSSLAMSICETDIVTWAPAGVERVAVASRPCMEVLEEGKGWCGGCVGGVGGGDGRRYAACRKRVGGDLRKSAGFQFRNVVLQVQLAASSTTSHAAAAALVEEWKKECA